MFKKLWPFRKINPTAVAADAGLFKEVFQYLTDLISEPSHAEQLIQLGKQADGSDLKDTFHTYLLFEKYLCNFEPGKKYTSQSLRDRLKSAFPSLMQKELFPILFVADGEKKNTIAHEFISSFIAEVVEQYGQVEDGYFERKEEELLELDKKTGAEGTFRELQFLSLEVFQFVNKNYGDTFSAKIFEKTYEKFSGYYKELEVFPHLITLIPKEIVRKEHLGIFTQAQIEQVFLEKLAETEKLNIALDQKIKEQEATQRLLSKNEIMLSSVISSAPDAIIIANEEGKVIQWNETATEIFGYSFDEIKGKEVIGNLVPESYIKKANFKPELFLNNPKNKLLNKRFEIICTRKDGTAFPAELTITSFQNGNNYFFNGFIRDISIPKQKEEELVKTKLRAEQAAKAKSQFLSVMSHEIRTPLNAIIGFTELLSQNAPRPDQLEDLKMLKFSGENLLNIINDILDFNKLDSGKVQLSCVPFNLRELTQSLYQSFSYKAREKQIEFEVEFDEKIPYVVKGDSLRLSQVLNNLISNAIKFTTLGSVKLKITLEGQSPGGISVMFSVVDTGIGIPKEKHEKIFEQFIQADSDTTRLFGGTGLGLSISNKLAQLMGSRIALKSVPKEGSTFYFTTLFQPSDDNLVAENKSLKKPKDSFLHKRILLAEDNPFNANIARRYITGWGAEMDLALDGKQALEFALRKKYDMILMDVQMPVLDGFQCSRAIRQHLPFIPIVAVTAAHINEVLEDIKLSGMNDHVSKPFKPNELFQKLEKYLLAAS